MRDDGWRRRSLYLFIAILLSACSSSSDPDTGRGEDRTGHAGSQTLPTSVFAYGIVEARKHSTLSAKFPGKLETIFVKEGEQVAKEQVLALFEAREVEAQLDVARAAVQVAEAQLAEARAGSREQEIAVAEARFKQAEAELSKARLDWNRSDDLEKRGLVAESEWEAARLDLDRAVAAYDAASHELSLRREGTRAETIERLRREFGLARARVGLAEAALQNARITAPYDGVVTRKHREEGEALDVGIPVMDIATLDDRYVRAEIDETDIGKIRLGQKTVVTADGFPGLAFEGHVADIKKQMGPKRLIPTDPSKMVDFKVLDVEVSLPEECPFHIKLPVNVRIFIENDS